MNLNSLAPQIKTGVRDKTRRDKKMETMARAGRKIMKQTFFFF